MNRIGIAIGIFFLKALSYLPFWFLYGLSDIFSLALFHIIKYRKGVVLTNLRLSFQEKSEKEISEIARIVLEFHNRKIPAVLGLSADQRPATITRLLIIRQI